MSQALINAVQKLQAKTREQDRRIDDLEEIVLALKPYVEDNFQRKRGPKPKGEDNGEATATL